MNFLQQHLAMRWLCILVLLAGWALCPALLADAGTRRTIEIIHTSDLHASLNLPDEPRPGMMLKVATAIASERQRVGKANCLYIDTGDLMQGSIIGTLTKGQGPVAVLKAMECEVFVPGNHDFEFGVRGFEQLLNELDRITICGNLEFLTSNRIPLPAWKLFMRNGVKIAVIGATASYLKNWFLEDINEAYHATPAVDLLKKCLPEVLKEKPDVIILALHQGWVGEKQDVRGVNEVAAIAQRFPQIDLILGGHTHRAFSGRKIGPRAWYLQPGAHGEKICVAEIECDTARHEVSCIRSRFIVPAENLPDEPVVRKALEDCCRKFSLPNARSVVAPALNHDVYPKGKCGDEQAMSTLFCRALMRSSGAELALHGVLSKASLRAGEAVTLYKLFEIVPFENTIVTAEVTKEELEAIMTEQQTLKKSYTHAELLGAQVQFDEAGKAHVVSPWPRGSRKRLAINSFAAAGSGRTVILKDIIRRPECRMKLTGISTREAVLQELKIAGKK